MGSEPVVVQGTPVQPSGGGGFAGALNSNNGGGGGDYGDQRNAYGAAANTAVATPMTGDIQNNENRGEKQEVKCRDPIFAVLFYANIVAILVVAIIYGPDALQTDDDNAQENQDYEGYVYASLIMAFVSFFASAGGLAIMMCIPETLIKVALISTVVLAGVWMVIAFLTGNIGLGIIGLIFFAITCCYAYFVWSRIPFATINLVTAMRAVTRNAGVIGFAYIITAVAAGWCICWTVAFVGVFDKTYECDENGENCDNPNYGYLFLLFLAFFFGQQVLQNTVHVVTAGTVGHWWFEPSDAQGCCSAAVVGSFIRATTTSFGSICFGSFIVAVIRALEALVHTARAQGDGNECLLCVIECLLSCIGNLVEYFNKWAFIYVGLYGYGYLEAGKSVITLLRNRGWEAIIADDLVNNTLLLVSVLVGCVVGCIGLVVESTSDLFDDAGGDAKAVSFFLGLLIGLFIASVALSTIASGVNAVIVLFAEAPADFQRNHPDLSEKMRTIWAQTYPGSI